MPKRAFTSPKGNIPKFPYSQAVIHGDVIYVSAQPPVDPATDQPVPGGVSEQTRQILTNVAGILVDAGTSIDNVLKVTAILKDRSHFSAFNEAYAEVFKTDPPARTTLYSDTGASLVLMDFIAAMD
jgi:2-iminobutanoate/2-iminopropanoate deaminase